MDVVKAVDLSFFRYSGLNWSLKKGHIHAIVGGSGVGKSTFLRVFLGLTKYSGNLLNSKGEKWMVENENISVQFQNSALLSHLSIGANIYLPLCMQQDLPIQVAEYIALHYMKMVRLTLDDFHKLPAECSGGMQKRAALARALISSPSVLFLDEPTSGLDTKMAMEYDFLLKELRDKTGLSILMISHDLDRVAQIADLVTFINKDGFVTDTFYNLKNHDNIKIRDFFS